MLELSNAVPLGTSGSGLLCPSCHLAIVSKQQTGNSGTHNTTKTLTTLQNTGTNFTTNDILHSLLQICTCGQIQNNGNILFVFKQTKHMLPLLYIWPQIYNDISNTVVLKTSLQMPAGKRS